MNWSFLFFRIHTHIVYFLLWWSIDLIKLMFTWLVNLVDWMLNKIVLVSYCKLYYLWLVTNRCKLLVFIFVSMLTVLLLSHFDYILFLTFLLVGQLFIWFSIFKSKICLDLSPWTFLLKFFTLMLVLILNNLLDFWLVDYVFTWNFLWEISLMKIFTFFIFQVLLANLLSDEKCAFLNCSLFLSELMRLNIFHLVHWKLLERKKWFLFDFFDCLRGFFNF